MTLKVADYAEWREAARRLLGRSTPPADVTWLSASDQATLPFPGLDAAAPPTAMVPRVPRAFMAIAELAADHRSPRKWDALYRLVWRVVREGRQVLEIDSDPDVRAVKDLADQVRRDEHKMRAFVRFTTVSSLSGSRYVAWYEPDHLIVRRAAAFFADRFGSMDWSILTPDLSVHWDRARLTFSEGVPTAMVAATGETEALWRVYYEAVFNPARVNPRAMAREMPLRRWRNLPEATLIPQLVKTAYERTEGLKSSRPGPTARPFIPATTDLDELRHASSSCRGCPLYEPATQVVFGEGPAAAALVLVGEQPGDMEDLAGRPFVGPAGQVLDAAFAAAGVDRQGVYLTNAVKHFAFEERGKRRIHRTPRMSEMHACRPWLEAELQALSPTTVVAMGATAARALLGPQARVMALRGRVLEGLAWAPRVVVTVHPSAVLRSQAEGARYFEMLVSDLTLAGVGRARPDAGGQT